MTCWSSAENWAKGIFFTCPLDILRTTLPLNSRTKSAFTVLPLTSVQVRGLASRMETVSSKPQTTHANNRKTRVRMVGRDSQVPPGKNSPESGSPPLTLDRAAEQFCWIPFNGC